ncbi:oligosaccharide flippase family protein [Zunongwangia sp. F363]|uniref:Oligosaccharide flippase family protein n=1 Tax=Autumnicola tepida TaxID=3075595 RepID=A0ABU3C7G2_9FLAO|nr:oligosaccharide flippase family protein [Zunongwangia sp. F363]MDT0642277.1 oligosaccharide flippase family protein [Zunongwangia sp. F363]
MSQLKKGVILSYVTIILTNVIGLVLTPFIIRSLGNSEYGLYALIGAFVGYISVLDLGLNNTIVRYVAQFRAENDKKGEESFLSTTMMIYGVISVLIGLIGILLYYNLESIFGSSLTSEEMTKAKVMFLILIFNIAITLPGGAFTAISNGYEHFVFPRTINIVRYIVRSAAVVGLLLMGGDAIGLVLLDTLMNILIIIVNGFYVFKRLGVRFKLHTYEFSLVKVIFSYSIWIFIFAIVQQFQWKGGQVLLGIKTDTVTVGIYAVGIVLGSYYSSFSGAISSVFLPKATQMVVKSSTKEELTGMMIKIGRLSLIVLLAILGAFILFGKQFVTLWVGESYELSWIIALTVMLAYTLPLIQNFANSLLEANKKFYFKAIIYLIFIGLGTLLGWFLIDSLGMSGMIYGIVAGWLVALIIMNIYYHKILKLDIPQFFKEVFRRILPGFIIVMCVGFLIKEIPGSGWLNFSIKSLLYITAYCLVFFTLALNGFERSLVANFFKLKVRLSPSSRL